MTMAEELEALRANESIKGENLRELARLVIEYSEKDSRSIDLVSAYNAMIEFAKGIEQ